MKKHLKIVVAALLVMACVGALLGFAACKDKKESAKITAELEQNFVYDGQVHNVVATLSHDEAELSYDPQQGFKDIGTYTVTISAPATENYNAPAPVTVTVNILDPSSIAKEELAGKLAGGVTDFNISKSMGVDVGVDLSYKPSEGEGWGYKLNVKGTLDLNVPDNTAFSVSLTDTVSSAQKFAITYLGKEDVIYVQVAENKYKLENSDILAALGIEAGDVNVTMGTYLSMVLTALGDNCTVSEDGNTYTMDFNLKNTLNSSLGDIIGGVLNGLDQDLVNTIYSLFGASDWSSFVAKLPDISGKMEIKFADGMLSAVALKNVSYTNGDSKGTIQANVSPFSISNSKVKVQAPADKDSYTAKKLLNLNAEGVLSLTMNGTSYVDYKVELMADLDILSLINGANENTGKLYLRLSHICTEECGAYCTSKMELSEGSVLEIGYDSSINPTSVYIVAGLRNLLSVEFIKSLGGLASIVNDQIATYLIPEYTAITADLTGLLTKAVAIPEEGEGSGSDEGSGNEGGTNILSIVSKVLGNLDFSVGNGKVAELNIDLSGLLTDLGADASLVSTLGGIFGNPANGNAMGGLSLTINSVGLFDTDFSEFDMINTLTKVKDASVEGDKVFTTASMLGMGNSPGLAQSAKTWEIVNLSDSNVPDMYTDLDLSMITAYEIQNLLIGNEVFFKVTTLDGTVRESVPAKIWGVSGINWDLIGQPQDIQLLVSVPQTIINGTVTDALAGTINVYELFKTTVPVTITLAEASDFELVMGESFGDGTYEVLDFLPADFANATITYTKTAGDKSEQGSIAVTNATDLSKYFWTPALSKYSDYVTINGEGIKSGSEKDGMPLAINPGTVTLTYEAYGQTFTKDITITDPYIEKSVSSSVTEATVGSSVSADLTFTLKKSDETSDTIVLDASSRYAGAGIVSFPEDMTVSDGSDTDVMLYTSYWKYNTFPGTIDQESVQTEVYFDIFGEHFVQSMTLKNKTTTYKATVSTPQVNGLTATFEVTISNNAVGYGQDYTGLTIKVENYSSSTTSYPVRVENCEVSTSVESVDLANDMQGGTIKFTVTVTANEAGRGRFYIRLYNGENRVVSGYTANIDFVDPSASAEA